MSISGLLKLGRILRLSKIIAFLNSTADIKASLMVTKMVMFLIVYIHCFACLWWQVVKIDQQWIPISGIVSGNYMAIYNADTNLIKKYILCVHTSMQMMMGVDVLPR